MEDKEKSTARYPATLAWLGLAAVYLGFLSVGFVFHFLPPILPAVIADLGLSHGQAGLLMSLFALPGILLSLPGGWLVDRYGERLVGSLGVIVMGAGTLLLGVAPSFFLILVARVLSGIGAMVGVVALQRLVTRLFAGRSLGLPVGISGSAIPVGIVLVLNAAGPVAESSGWRAVPLRVGGVTALAGVIFALVVWVITRGQELGREPEQDEAASAGRAHRFRPIWIAGAVWFCANGAMTAFMTFAPDHFRGLGFDVSARGLFTSIPMWTSAALGMVTGWLTDRHGGRSVFMAVGMTMMGLALVVLPAGVVPPSLIGLVLGLSLAAVVTPTIALPGVLLPPSHIGRGYGILATCANLGIFLVPPVAGVARDLSGGYVWPFVIMGVVAFGGVAAADRLRRGHFTPGLSRKVLATAVLVLIAGCGRQDRYEVVVPAPELAGVVHTGHITEVTSLLNMYRLNAADAWSADDLVLVGNRGRVIRVQGDLYTSLQWPADEDLIGVLCQPGGELLVVSEDERFWRWQSGSWQELAPVPGDRVRLLARGDLGRPLAVDESPSGGLYRYESGAWNQVADQAHGVVTAIWSDPQQGLWLATDNHSVLQVTSTVEVVADTLEFAITYRAGTLVGDGSDRLAYSLGGREMWLAENGTWRHFAWPGDPYLDTLFWQGGLLHAVDSRGDLYIWQDEDWRPEDSVQLANRAFDNVPLAGGHLVIGDNGGAVFFDGVGATVAAYPQGNVDSVAEADGRLYVYLDSGSLFQATDATAQAWRFLLQADTQGFGNVLEPAMLPDDRGRLVIRGADRLWEWNGFSLVDLSGGRDTGHMFQLPGGEILMAMDGGLGSLRHGVLSTTPVPGLSLYSTLGVRRLSPTTLELLLYQGVYRYEVGGEPVLRWAPVGWSARSMIPFSQELGMILGDDAVRELVGDEIRDITPLVHDSGEIREVEVSDVLQLADGRFVAWSNALSCLLLRDDEGWHVVDPLDGPSNMVQISLNVGRLVATPNHGFFLHGHNVLARFDLDGAAP